MVISFHIYRCFHFIFLLIQLCWVILACICMLGDNSIMAVTYIESCPKDEIMVLERKCMYWGEPTDWTTAVNTCTRLGSNITLLHLMENHEERHSVYSYLRDNNISSVWVEASRPDTTAPILYQLPKSIFMTETMDVVTLGKKLPVFETNGVKWSSLESSEENRCVKMSALAHDKELTLELEDCAISLPFACITEKLEDRPNRTDVSPEKLEPPVMLLRKSPDGFIFLEVRNVDSLWNFQRSEPHTTVSHPWCLFQGPYGTVQLYFQDFTVSRLTGHSTAFYTVVTEEEGYLICHGYTGDTMAMVHSNTLLIRLPTTFYIVKLRFSSSLCRPLCDVRVSSSFLDAAQDDIRSATESSWEHFRLTLLAVRDRTPESVTIVYRLTVIPDMTVEEIRRTLGSRLPYNLLLSVLEVRNVDYCEAYNMSVSGNVLALGRTPVGYSHVPRDTCTLPTGEALYVHCSGNFTIGASWENVSHTVTCIPPKKRLQRLQRLKELAGRNVSASNLLAQLNTSLAPTSSTNRSLPDGPLTAQEVCEIAEVLAGLKAQPQLLLASDLEAVVNITNTLMTQTPRTSLWEAQNHTNSSNSILDSLDRLQAAVALAGAYELAVRDRIVTMVTDVTSGSKFRGLASHWDAIYGVKDVRSLSTDDTVASLLAANVSAAVILPESLFTSTDVSYENATKRIVTNIFWDASLFGSNGGSPNPGHVISVTVSGHHIHLADSSLLLLFRRPHGTNRTGNESLDGDGHGCVFWEFTANGGRGGWSSTGCQPLPSMAMNPSVDVCSCDHFTHFGRLLYEDDWDAWVSASDPAHTQALTYLSIIGSCLSIIGLTLIFVTAIVVREWCRGTGKKLHLNLSMACLLLMLSFLTRALLNDDGENASVCVTTGVLMHFSLLSLYLWMFTVAVYQCRRLTDPLGSLNPIRHYLLVASLISWGCPALVCAVILCVDMDVYGAPNCYPQGTILMYAVFVPVGVLLTANAIVLFLILCSIYKCVRCGTEMLIIHEDKRRSVVRKLAASGYLFMVLGLCWVFGFLRLHYLFCATATLQGLSFFFFFVLRDSDTRDKWRRFLRLSLPHGRTRTCTRTCVRMRTCTQSGGPAHQGSHDSKTRGTLVRVSTLSEEDGKGKES